MRDLRTAGTLHFDYASLKRRVEAGPSKSPASIQIVRPNYFASSFEFSADFSACPRAPIVER